MLDVNISGAVIIS